jgi:adenylylsulfate kinase-like enzyme
MWIRRLSGLGKSTLACTLECCLMPKGKFRYVLDGGQHAPLLDHNLGFSIVDWRENIRCYKGSCVVSKCMIHNYCQLHLSIQEI